MKKSRKSRYATKEEVREVIKKWEKSDKKMSDKDISILVYCAKGWYADREYSSWDSGDDGAFTG